tara:strand:+ start:993 stop:1856 length:864 start_codon:yes stop_codon:yes gene_type:complete
MTAANAAASDVEPLLAYYGVLSLSRGLILFLSNTLRENGLSQAHGLTVNGWGQELAKPTGDVASLIITLNTNGTLRQLVEATQHASFLRNNANKPNAVVRCNALPETCEVTLLDLLSRIPEVRSQQMRWRATRNAVSIWPQTEQSNGDMHVRIDRPYGKDDVEAVFGADAAIVSDQGGVLTYSLKGERENYYSDCTGPAWGIGALVVLRPMQNGLELSKLAMAFVASYALGMLVRYYPSHWVSMLQNVRHDGALPTMLATLEHIEEDVPRMVMEFLEPPASLLSETS